MERSNVNVTKAPVLDA